MTPKELLVRIALVVGGTAIGLLASELLARLMMAESPHVMRVEPVRETLADHRTSHHALPDHPEQGRVYLDTPTGRRLRPNIHVVIERHTLSERRIELKTNRQGFRNPEIGAKRGTRILFLGDSVTFADFLPEQETFVRLTEALARADGRAWETINAGVGAIGLKNELAILLESGLALELDAVVLGFYLNDFQPSPGLMLSEIPAAVQRSRLLTHFWIAAEVRSQLASPLDTESWAEELTNSLKSSERSMTPRARAFLARALANFSDWGGSFSYQAWLHMQPHFEQLRELADQNGFRLFVVAFPVRDQVEAGSVYNFPQQQLARIMRELDVPLLDTLPRLREAWGVSSDPLFYDHCHHTPRGSEVVAQEIYRFLADHLGAEGERQPSSRLTDHDPID